MPSPKAKRILFLCLGVLISCSPDDEGPDDGPVTVYGTTLGYPDLDRMVASAPEKVDSSEQLTQIYIDRWIEDQVLINQADRLPQEVKKELDQRVEEYRRSLFIYEVEQMLVNERLDTVVSQQEIEKYYHQHKQEFLLKGLLVKALFLKVPKEAPEIERVEASYQLQKPEDSVFITNYAKTFAVDYHYDPNNWIYMEELNKQLPEPLHNMQRFAMRKGHDRFEDEFFKYFIKVTDYMMEDQYSPLEFERNHITSRILQNRRDELKETIRKELIEKAENENAIRWN